MGLDMYINKVEIKPVEEELCYWRQDWDLFDYINQDIFEYGKEEYGKNHELSLNEVIKIRDYLKKNNGNRIDYLGVINKLNTIIGDMTNNDKPNTKYVFNADW